MKKYSLYILILVLISLFSACVDESLSESCHTSGNVNVIVSVTTPDLIDNSIDTRAAHNGSLSHEGKVNSLAVMVFEDGTDNGKLLQIANVAKEGTSNFNGKVSLTARQNVYVRLVANADLTGMNEGQDWSTIRSSLTYTVDNSSSQTFPMTSEVGTIDINSTTTIGTEAKPINLVRAMAKLTLSFSNQGAFTYEGNKVFQLVDKGYVFAQTSPDDLSTPAGAVYNDEAGAYNTNTVTYSASRKNTGADKNTPLDNRTYIIVKGKYTKANELTGESAAYESYYRIDLGKLAADNKMEYVDLKRNYNYLISVNIKGLGYATEELAKASPINSSMVEVTITESSAYEFVMDESGDYLGVSNSFVLIYGKSHYIPKGFKGTPIPYEYVLTTINTKKTFGLKAEDIVIEDAGLISDAKIKVVDRYDIDGNPILVDGKQAQEYILTGTLADMNPYDKAETFVTIRSGRLTKSIYVLQKEFVDCHYGNDAIGDAGSEVLSAYIRKHRMGDGRFSEHPDWVMFDENDTNLKTTDIGSFDNQTITGFRAVNVKWKENVKPEFVGKYSENAVNEGARFADLYFSYADNVINVKTIFSQSCADLSGYFGTSHDGHTTDTDDGAKYDSYLLLQRQSDYIFTPNDVLSTCTRYNPSDELTLWYTPSTRQLMGLWLTENSDSRKTSPMYGFRINDSNYNGSSYLGRTSYTTEHENHYDLARAWGNTDELTLSDMSTLLPPGGDKPKPDPNYPRRWTMDFEKGETGRGPIISETSTRCVRNLKFDELPAEIQAELQRAGNKPVSGNQVTMDPGGYLDKEVFDQSIDNPIARKIEVLPKSGTTNTTVYKYSNGWKSSSATIEKEYTLAEAWEESKKQGGRLPTQRELFLLYIYEPLLNSNSAISFNKENPTLGDGYYDPSGTESSTTPNRLLYKMYRYPAADNDPYMFWYWTSTTTNGKFGGTDNGVEPYRINFNFGDVSAREANQTGSKDHYRAVKTIQEQ